MAESDEMLQIEPLPYHRAIRSYLQQEEPQVWQWYGSNRVRAEQADALRFELLKSTYRLDRENHARLYNLADEAAHAIGLNAPITVYQAQNPDGLNASLAYLPGEAHVVFHGPITTRLSDTELKALLAHELAHSLLYDRWDGELLIAEQILSAMTNDRQATTAHMATARLFQLYTEIFCDRMALAATGSPLEVISMLVKVATGLEEVDANSYLKQADEILGKGKLKSEGLSHPEAYIRAHALRLWHDRAAGVDEKIARLIEGEFAIDELDLLGQIEVGGYTRQLIDVILAPQWIQTDLILSHARLYFEDYEPPTQAPDVSSVKHAIERSDEGMCNFYCYIMLDFASADRELEEAPLAHVMEVAESIYLHKQFRDIAAKELRLRKQQLDKIYSDRERIVATAEQAEASQ
jgi:Zn-dependent protease with chaperone function